MPTIVRVGDSAGGPILNSRGISTTINGAAIAVDGDDVTSHGNSPHDNATMTASTGVTINGIAICVTGDTATCGHAASGSAASVIS